jgi:hypothetical protein
MEDRLDPISINGADYYSVKQFANIVNKTTATIYNLAKKGNAIRKLKCAYFNGKPYIPTEELTEFPFAAPGPHGTKKPCFYDAQGQIRAG